MKRLHYLFILLLGFTAIGLLYMYTSISYETFLQKDRTLTKIYELRTLEIRLDFVVLNETFYLYQNFNKVITIQNAIDQKIQKLRKELGSLDDKEIFDLFEKYNEEIRSKDRLIEKYQRYNALIKNSTTYLITLLKRVPKTNNHHYITQVIDVVSWMILTKNSMDMDFLKNIEKTLHTFETLSTKDPKIRRFNNVLIAHLRIFVQNFPLYFSTLQEVLSRPTQKTLDKLQNVLLQHFDKEIAKIDQIFKAIIIFYIIALGLILLFFIRLDKENEALQRLQQKLYNQTLTDDLTKLKNRRAYKHDVRKINQPFFALINIDGFKHYNDFYGVAMGDHILRQCSLILKNAVPSTYRASFYRIGSDEFGILIDEKVPINDQDFAKTLLHIFAQTPIVFKKITITLSVSIAMSRKRPLLETADLTMKYLKKERRAKYLTYKDELGFMHEIKENIRRSKILKNAIEENRIVPFFQPIIDNKNATISKYEVLARIRHEDGTIESIFPYLPIAKELGLYEKITQQILISAIEIAHTKAKNISINISMKDIENPEFLTTLGRLFKTYPDVAQRLSFEILESETLKDYDMVNHFISAVRSQGSEVGIDDFGSGYSNFSHIFNLNIDFIKIDGSLIRELDTNKTAVLIVENIVRVAKELGVKTIAEFITNKDIYDKVQAMGIDYSQGFFLGEPSPDF